MKNLLITLGVIVAIAAIIISFAISVSNREVKLRMRGEAQQEVCKTFHDNMWKIINQDAQVTEKYRIAFDSIYTHIIAGRYSKGDGTLMKWITEANPNFDIKLYDKLMAAIEGQRQAFLIEQSKLIDIDREHKTMRSIFPNSFIVGNRKDINIIIITSSKTENVYKSGKDDDTKVF